VQSFNAAAIPGEDGRRYAKYGIGLSLLAIPAYVVGNLAEPAIPVGEARDPFGNDVMGPRVFAVTLVNAIVGAGAAALVFLTSVSLGFRRGTALIVALVAAFATPLAHYSGTFLSEPLAALCLIATIYGLVRASQIVDASGSVSVRWTVLSGFAAGLGVATKPALGIALIAPVLWMLWLAWRWSLTSPRHGMLAVMAWASPFVIWLALIALYNWSRFGSMLETGYGDEAGSYSTPFLTGLYGLLASPGRGLLWYAPPLLLSVAGALWFHRRSPALSYVILGSLVATSLLYSRYYAWHGGGVWGPRFLVPLLPLLILPAGEVIERAWGARRLAVSSIAVVMLGLAVSGLALLVPFDRYVAEYTTDKAAHDRALWSVAGSPVVVHARDVIGMDVTVDVAAVRYAAPSIGALTVVAGLAGSMLIACVLIQAIRPLRR
jgi:4-amino-4-deoxy-L-arabinose transferase-like glycosyltransferase